MSRLAFLAPLALACALAPAARASDVTPRIVRGSDASITDFPFQVALYRADTSPAATRFCGGAIIDTTHVITAAHCLFNLFAKREAMDPADVEVLAGTADLADSSSSVVHADVAKVSFDPSYDPSTNDYDVGVITLSSPLTFTTAIQKVDFVSEAGFADALAADPLPDLTVSGWGDLSPEPILGSGTPSFSNLLQEAQVRLVADATCVSDYARTIPPTPITPRMFCAGDHDYGSGITDSCQGDSGGPIVLGSPGSFVLAGLVDSGAGCAQPGFPGIYMRLADSDLTSFLISDPPQAPLRSGTTTVSGGNLPGQMLTCTAGGWTGAQDLTFQFLANGSNPLTPATATGTSYTIQESDRGSRISCLVKASNAGGYGFSESAQVVVPMPPVQPPPSPPPPVLDSTAPKLRVVSKRCTRTSCTVKVRVSDASPSSGIGRLEVTLGWSRRVRCKARRGKSSIRPARTCTKRVRKSLRARAGTGGNFTIVAKHLRPGTGYRLTLVPFDKAGNRPPFSTVTNVRTKSRHSSGLLL
jgi:hypothetical protein